MAITTKYTAWSPAAINAMEFLYNAGWQWPAIAAHVSAIDGVERTRDACRCKAHRLMMTRGRPRGLAPMHDIVADIEDMMILGYSTRQMARELGCSQTTVMRKIETFSPQRRVAWKRDLSERHAKAVSRSWVKRRAAA